MLPWNCLRTCPLPAATHHCPQPIATAHNLRPTTYGPLAWNKERHVDMEAS